MTRTNPRPSALSPVRDDALVSESVYRSVTALRATPDLAAESLAPDFYLAAADSAVVPHAPKERRT